MALLTLLLVVSIVQTYQYYQGILQHYSMDKEKYRYVFMRTGDEYKNLLGGNVDLMRTQKNRLSLFTKRKMILKRMCRIGLQKML